MKKILGFSALLLLFSLPTLAQYEGAEVGGGYTYRSLDVPASPRLSMNGWDFNAAANLYKWFGMAMDADGTRNDQGANGTTWTYTVMGGPRIYPMGHQKVTPFVQALFGKGFLTLNIPGFGSFSDGFFAWSAGGGVDWTVSRHIAVRLGEFDFEQLQSSFLDGFAPGPHQNDFKYKGGIVFRF